MRRFVQLAPSAVPLRSMYLNIANMPPDASIAWKEVAACSRRIQPGLGCFIVTKIEISQAMLSTEGTSMRRASRGRAVRLE